MPRVNSTSAAPLGRGNSFGLCMNHKLASSHTNPGYQCRPGQYIWPTFVKLPCVCGMGGLAWDVGCPAFLAAHIQVPLEGLPASPSLILSRMGKGKKRPGILAYEQLRAGRPWG